MPANNVPIFPKRGALKWATLTAANTAKDGTGVVGTIADNSSVTVANSAAVYDATAKALTITCAAHSKEIGWSGPVIVPGMTCAGANPSALGQVTATAISATQIVIPVIGDPGAIAVFGNTVFVTNGIRIDTIKCCALGTNVQSVLRVFINNGQSSAVAANNVMVLQKTLAPTTLDETKELSDVEIPINLVLPPGYKINVTIGTAAAAGWAVTGIAGEY